MQDQVTPKSHAFSSWRMASEQTKSDLVIGEIKNYEIFNLITCIITNLSFRNDDRLCTHDINKGIHINWGTFLYLKKEVPPNRKQKKLEQATTLVPWPIRH
jgi:hypothetical protein